MLLVVNVITKRIACEAYVSDLKAKLAEVRHNMDALRLKVEVCPVLNLLSAMACLTVETVYMDEIFTCRVVDGTLTG